MGDVNYYYRDNTGREVGPFTLDALIKLRFAGVLADGTSVRAENEAEWKALSEVILSQQSTPTTSNAPAMTGASISQLVKTGKTGHWFRRGPFIMVSCDNRPAMSLTGIQLAIGAEVHSNNPISGEPVRQKIQSYTAALLALLCCLLGVICAFIPGKAGLMGDIICGVAVLLLLFIVKLQLDDEMMKQGQGMLGISYEFGYMATCVLALAGAAVAFFQLKFGVVQAAGSPAPNSLLESLKQRANLLIAPLPSASSAPSFPAQSSPGIPSGQVPPAAAAPRAPRVPLSLKAKLQIGGGFVLAVLLLLGYLVTKDIYRVPNHTAIKNAVEAQVKKPGQRVADVTAEIINDADPKHVQLRFAAKMELTEPYYTQLNPSTYVTSQGADSSLFDRITVLMEGRGGARIRELANITGNVENLNQCVLLKQSAPVGYSYNIIGNMSAGKYGNAWQLSLSGMQPDQNQPQGQIASEFQGKVMITDRPEDAEKLKSIIANAKDVVQRLEKAQQTYAQEDKAAQQQRIVSAISKIQVGSLFVGSASEGRGDPKVLYFEITALDKDQNTVTAILRNDGGWIDARRFQGTYSYDTDRNVLNVKLATRSDDAVRDCGPFLELIQDWTITCSLDGDSLTGKSGNWSYTFNRVADDQKDSAIAKARDEEMKWLAATQQGKMYRVFTTVSQKAWSKEYLFTFTKQERNGIVLEGVLEQPGRGWRRHFRGTLIANRYKADGKTLRLITENTEQVVLASKDDNLSPLGNPNTLSWYPKLDNGRFTCDSWIVGGSDNWHMEFEPISKDEADKMTSSVEPPDLQPAPATVAPPPQAAPNPANPMSAAQAVSLLSVANNQQPTGAITQDCSFVGFMCTFHGERLEKVALHIKGVNSSNGSSRKVTCLLESLDRPGAKRILTGTLVKGNGLDLATNDSLGKKEGMTDLFLNSFKFDVTVNGESKTNGKPTSEPTPKSGDFFAGGVCDTLFLLKPSGLFGMIKETERLLLLQPAE